MKHTFRAIGVVQGLPGGLLAHDATRELHADDAAVVQAVALGGLVLVEDATDDEHGEGETPKPKHKGKK
jgi:hypothetical protein